MKITDVSLDSYRWPRNKPIRNGRYTYPNSGIDVVEVKTDNNITGIGLAGALHDEPSIGPAILKHLKQYVLDQDPFDTEKIWSDMWQPKLIGRRGIATRVISGIDIALWDIKGKATGQPLYKLLGGFTSSMPVYIAGGYYEENKTLNDLAEEMCVAVGMGTNAIKMKIGGAPINEDVERVSVVRDAVGPNIKLMVDANCAYRFYEAIEIARKLEKYDIYWFEEPVNPDDYQGHKMVSESTSIPIATGENEYTRYGFRDLIKDRCVAIVQPDATVMGGITEYMKVAAMAQAHDMPVAPHGNQDLHIHLAAAIPNGLILEYYTSAFDPMWNKMFTNVLRIQDGQVSPPDRPGLGIDLNKDALARYHVGPKT